MLEADTRPEVVQLVTRHRTPWAVALEVVGHAWVHQWHGYASNADDASAQAKLDFFGGLFNDPAIVARYPLRVRSCMQLPAEC